MSEKGKNTNEEAGPDTQQPDPIIEKPRKLIEQEPGDNIQHGRQQQRPDVNPRTNVQPGHRDREEI